MTSALSGRSASRYVAVIIRSSGSKLAAISISNLRWALLQLVRAICSAVTSRIRLRSSLLAFGRGTV